MLPQERNREGAGPKPCDRTSGAEGEYPVPERCLSYRIWHQGCGTQLPVPRFPGTGPYNEGGVYRKFRTGPRCRISTFPPPTFLPTDTAARLFSIFYFLAFPRIPNPTP